MVSLDDRTADQATAKRERRVLRIGFWGTHGRFTNRVLTALVKRYALTHVALPTTSASSAAVALSPPPATALADDLLIVNHCVTPTAMQTAWQHGVPVYAVNRLQSPAVHTWLAELALDVICVACFPWRIPATLLCLPTYGFLNVHPSRLPAYRGPAPLFWQLRDGVRDSGVTLHWMDATFDTGAIAAQAPFALPDGAPSAELDRLSAAVGSDLLCSVLRQLEDGTPPRQAQPVGGSHQSWPTADDFRLSLQWSARHAYNFMRGTAEWQQPYPVNVAGEELWLRTALAYEPQPPAALADNQLLTRNGAELLIRFQPGLLRALPW